MFFSARPFARPAEANDEAFLPRHARSAAYAAAQAPFRGGPQRRLWCPRPFRRTNTALLIRDPVRSCQSPFRKIFFNRADQSGHTFRFLFPEIAVGNAQFGSDLFLRFVR